MAVLQSRLDQREMVRQAQMNAQYTQSLTDNSWGNQIRSYVLHVRFSTTFVLFMVCLVWYVDQGRAQFFFIRWHHII